MSDNYVIKVCYFCDYPKNVSADYEENIDENGNYHTPDFCGIHLMEDSQENQGEYFVGIGPE